MQSAAALWVVESQTLSLNNLGFRVKTSRGSVLVTHIPTCVPVLLGALPVKLPGFILILPAAMATQLKRFFEKFCTRQRLLYATGSSPLALGSLQWLLTMLLEPIPAKLAEVRRGSWNSEITALSLFNTLAWCNGIGHLFWFSFLGSWQLNKCCPHRHSLVRWWLFI